MPRVKYLSMFSGVGGFELGIQNAFGKTVGGGQENPPGDTSGDRAGLFPAQGQSTGGSDGRPSTSSPDQPDDGPLCIGYSEIDKYAVQTYEKNFKEHKNYGDATKINESDLPDFGLLVGGFPCQAFSVAGKRRGFDDTRGTLFFDIARILKHKRPRHIFLENVKGLLSHDSGKTFQTILGVLADLGYRIEWQVLNGKRWVPQNRERVVIIGHLRGECGRKILPIAGGGGATATVAGYISPEDWPNRHEQIKRVYDTDGASPTIPTGTGGGVMTKILQKSPDWRSQGKLREFTNHSPAIRADMGDNFPMLKVAEATKKGYAEATVGQSVNLNQPNSKTRRGRVSDLAPTIDTVMQVHTLTPAERIRRLTPLECERLMGWPDNWTEGVSDSQRYKQCGNGIIAPMVEAVIRELIPCLEDE